MPGLMEQHTAPVGRLPNRTISFVVAVIVALILVLVISSRLVASPKSVPSITVRNDTAFAVRIAASDRLGGAQTPVGVVAPHAATTFSGVADEGSTWIFDLSSEGVSAGTLTMTRHDLASAQWTLTLGRDIDAKLRAEGLTP